MLVQTTSFTMVRRLNIYVSPFYPIHMNRIHYANYFGLTIWWRQQDGSGANRSMAFGVFGTHFFLSIDCENPRSRRSHAARCEALPPFREIVQPLSPPNGDCPGVALSPFSPCGRRWRGRSPCRMRGLHPRRETPHPSSPLLAFAPPHPSPQGE